MSKHHSKPKLVKAPDPEMKNIEQSNALASYKSKSGYLSSVLGNVPEEKEGRTNAYAFTGNEHTSAGQSIMDEFYKRNDPNKKRHTLARAFFKMDEQAHKGLATEAENIVYQATPNDTSATNVQGTNSNKKKAQSKTTSNILGTTNE